MIVAIPPTLAALCSLLVNITNKKRLDDLHIMVNSRLDELLKQKGIASFSEGEKQGAAENERKAAQLRADSENVKGGP